MKWGKVSVLRLCHVFPKPSYQPYGISPQDVDLHTCTLGQFPLQFSVHLSALICVRRIRLSPMYDTDVPFSRDGSFTTKSLVHTNDILTIKDTLGDPQAKGHSQRSSASRFRDISITIAVQKPLLFDERGDPMAGPCQLSQLCLRRHPPKATYFACAGSAASS